METKGTSSNFYPAKPQLAAVPQWCGWGRWPISYTRKISSASGKILFTDPHHRSPLQHSAPSWPKYLTLPKTPIDMYRQRFTGWYQFKVGFSRKYFLGWVPGFLHYPTITTSNWCPGKKTAFVNLRIHEVPGICTCQMNKFFWQHKSDPTEKPF